MAPTGAALFMKFMDPGGPGGIIPPAAENEWLIFSALSKLLPGKGCIADMAGIGIGISVAKLWETAALFGSRDFWANTEAAAPSLFAALTPNYETRNYKLRNPKFSFLFKFQITFCLKSRADKNPRVTLGRFLASATLPELNRYTRHHEFH